MNTQSININHTDNVTETTSVSVISKITKDAVQQKSDAELLQLIQKATGHTGKDFPDYMGCDFSYTYLTGLLKDRGYEMGWHKTSEGSSPAHKSITIPMKKINKDTVRQSYMIEKNVAEDWKQFNRNIPYKTVTISWALRRFMEDVKYGRIKFELEI